MIEYYSRLSIVKSYLTKTPSNTLNDPQYYETCDIDVIHLSITDLFYFFLRSKFKCECTYIILDCSFSCHT